jgi:hypothetical protein
MADRMFATYHNSRAVALAGGRFRSGLFAEMDTPLNETSARPSRADTVSLADPVRKCQTRTWNHLSILAKAKVPDVLVVRLADAVTRAQRGYLRPQARMAAIIGPKS